MLVNDPSCRIMYETQTAQAFTEAACMRAGVRPIGMTDDTPNYGLQFLRALRELLGEKEGDDDNDTH
jgi:hypothetical protein